MNASLSVKRWAALWVAALLFLWPGTAFTREFPLKLLSAEPLPELAQKFHGASGWTGGDGDYSIPLSKNETLWLFGDSYIGPLKDGRRIDPAFINNSAALQALDKPEEPLRFFWGHEGKSHRALLEAPKKNQWLWPGDGATVDGALYLFYKIITPLPGEPQGFNFRWSGDVMYRITNPGDVQNWKYTLRPLPCGPEGPRMGTACLVDGKYLYIYGLSGNLSTAERKTIVARLPLSSLPALDFREMEYWCRGNRWLKEGSPLTLYEEGATEMSVSRVPGIEGYINVYTPGGCGPLINVRHSMSPEGPWSDPLTVYRCPEEKTKLFLYGAKAHPELSEARGRLIITYCRNSGSLEEDLAHPEIYYPQAVDVRFILPGSASGR